MTEWTIEEDAQPGAALIRQQPEVTPRGKVWTQLIEVNWPTEGRTQLMIREVGDDIRIDHGRVFPLHGEDDNA